MDWKHTFNAFYNGETDDTFIPTGDKYLSSYNIDPSSNPRYLQLSERLVTTGTMVTTADITDILALPGSAYVYTGNWNVFYNSTEVTSTIAGSSYTFAHYLWNSAWLMKVYVFDWSNVHRMNDTLSVKELSTPHATGIVTAVCQATNTLVFSVWNVLYQVNNAGWISTVLSTLPYGISVKKLYFYNDVLYIFTQDWPDAKIYQARYNGSSYDILYWHTKEDISLYDMCGTGWKMYWTSNVWLYQTDWVDSKLIKRNLFSSASRCSIFQDNFVYIIDWASVYRYGTSLPSFPNPFVKLYTHTTSLASINWSNIAESRSGWSVNRVSFGGRASTGEIITMPYDSWVLWAEKNLEVLCFPYELKTGNDWASIQVQIQTNLMELNNTAIYVNVKTLNTLSNSVSTCRIDTQEILTALWSNVPEFTYFRLKIILNRSTSTEYSPKVYQDIYIAGSWVNDIKKIW